jgi:hypothetical protein
MKKILVLLAAAVTLLAGCVVDTYPDRYSDGYSYGSREGYHRDRDGDGVPNRRDRRPDNPYRY